MHSLDRTSVCAPSCLETYDYRSQTWDDLRSDCKGQLHRALEILQGNRSLHNDALQNIVRCAYCENIIRHARHVEHFRRKNNQHYPQFTFEWTNLFLSCGSNAHCGHYKDRKSALPYDPDQLIKPDECNPEDYLYFHSSGAVRVRSGLNDADGKKARETIRVFGLNEPPLLGMRSRSIANYREGLLAELDELETWSSEDRNAYLQEEVEATRWDPFATTIKHFLQTQL